MQMSPVFLGILLLLIGATFFALVWGVLRLIPRLRIGHPTPAPAVSQSETSSSENAVILVEGGGRVGYINPAARQWFNLRAGEQPSLEVLANRVRSSDEFLKICAGEGQARFSLNGRPLECISYQVPGPVPAILVALNRPGLSTGLEMTVGGSLSALKILTDFNRAISAMPDFQSTVKAVLENIEQLIPVESLQVKLWDVDQEGLLPYRFVAAPRSERKIESGVDRKSVV